MDKLRRKEKVCVKGVLLLLEFIAACSSLASIRDIFCEAENHGRRKVGNIFINKKTDK